MRRSLFILILLISFYGCKKEEKPVYEGTETIDNTLYGVGPYYALGFSFSLAKKLSTLDNPRPDISVIADVGIDGTIRRLMLQTEINNYFYRVGDYQDESSAKTAFNNLTSASVPRWEELADTIRANQIWIFRSASEHYSKFRIVKTIAEKRDDVAYAECTFEWVYQPDGTLTFPGK